jgi:hypothetical protein
MSGQAKTPRWESLLTVVCGACGGAAPPVAAAEGKRAARGRGDAQAAISDADCLPYQ